MKPQKKVRHRHCYPYIWKKLWVKWEKHKVSRGCWRHSQTCDPYELIVLEAQYRGGYNSWFTGDLAYSSRRPRNGGFISFWLHLRRAIPRGLAECSSRRDGGKWNVDGSDCMINGGPTIIRRENGWHSISIGIERAWDPFYADTWVPAHQTVHCPAQKLPINANWAVVNQLVSLEVIFIEFVESYTDASRQVQSCSLSKHVALMPRAFSSCHSVSKLRAEYSISHNM